MRLERASDRRTRAGAKIPPPAPPARPRLVLSLPNSRTCVSAMSRTGPNSWKRFGWPRKHEPWLADLARAIPVEQTFSFTPESLTEQMKQATAPFVGRMTDGTFHVRQAARAPWASNEPGGGTLCWGTPAGAGRNSRWRLQVSFANPDYIVAAETVGNQCGIALLGRALIDHFLSCFRTERSDPRV